MNRYRDIEQVLDAWFVEGSAHMPDRLFDAVLDEVGRMPQRRRPWSTQRVRPMSFQLRLAAAAAFIVAIGGSVLLLGRPPNQPVVGQTPGPSPSASSFMDGRVTAALNHTFIGAPRPKPAADVPDESIITFSTATLGPDRFDDWSFSYDVEYFASEVTAPGRAELQLASTEAGAGCSVGDVGRYRWTLSPGGTRLRLELVSDVCEARGAVVAGDWLRADCPSPEPPDGLCLGELEAGDYTTQYFDPFQAPGPGWRARYGALRYTVPDGWENLEDAPWNYHLHRLGDPPDSGIYLFGDVRVWDQGEDCLERIDERWGPGARPIIEWLRSTDGIVATIPREVRFGGITGTVGSRLDVRMITDRTEDPLGGDPWTTTCPFSGGLPYKGLFVDGDPARGTAWGLLPETHMRLFVVGLPDGRPLVIDIEAPDAESWNAMLDEATAIVESMTLDPGPGG